MDGLRETGNGMANVTMGGGRRNGGPKRPVGTFVQRNRKRGKIARNFAFAFAFALRPFSGRIRYLWNILYSFLHDCAISAGTNNIHILNSQIFNGLSVCTLLMPFSIHRHRYKLYMLANIVCVRARCELNGGDWALVRVRIAERWK